MDELICPSGLYSKTFHAHILLQTHVLWAKAKPPCPAGKIISYVVNWESIISEQNNWWPLLNNGHVVGYKNNRTALYFYLQQYKVQPNEKDIIF